MTDTKELPPLPEAGLTIPQWQSYVDKLIIARGWDRASDLEIFLLFTEEVGELAKAFRQHRELFVEKKPDSQKKDEMASEMADVLSYLFDLANRMGVDLEKAALEKERVNRNRTWSC